MDTIFEIPRDMILKKDKAGVCRAMSLAWLNEMMKNQIPDGDWVSKKNVSTWADLQKKYRKNPDNSPIIKRLNLNEDFIFGSYDDGWEEKVMSSSTVFDLNNVGNGAYYMSISYSRDSGQHGIGFFFNSTYHYALNQNEGMLREGASKCTKKKFIDNVLRIEKEYAEKELDARVQSQRLYTISREEAKKSKGILGSCYLTTATCQSLGLGDRCYELETLRSYRDEWLAAQEQGQNEIDFYYKTAPGVVEKINQSDHAETIYRQIYEELVEPSVSAIEAGHHERARELYKKVSLKLFNQYQ
ncbi:CFI-box-CTERM domain-containing protein [Endozoicomonas numazuensis]|uniref:CFI-box-CTERM domain-containing protein n=1 Tax=Endozoicomonas numazuensis TaxID=1137799 RepID=UPI0006912262|nr:CFI-box-CTERM domain-containing protein [Endozoicomonas numazuensis]